MSILGVRISYRKLPKISKILDLLRELCTPNARKTPGMIAEMHYSHHLRPCLNRFFSSGKNFFCFFCIQTWENPRNHGFFIYFHSFSLISLVFHVNSMISGIFSFLKAKKYFCFPKSIKLIMFPLIRKGRSVARRPRPFFF